MTLPCGGGGGIPSSAECLPRSSHHRISPCHTPTPLPASGPGHSATAPHYRGGLRVRGLCTGTHGSLSLRGGPLRAHPVLSRRPQHPGPSGQPARRALPRRPLRSSRVIQAHQHLQGHAPPPPSPPTGRVPVGRLLQRSHAQASPSQRAHRHPGVVSRGRLRGAGSQLAGPG